jgi:hypothetical protein
MPYRIKLDAPLVGVSTSIALEGETAAIQTRGFFCSDDPTLLSKVLDGFWSSILARLPAGAVPAPSHVRHALAVILKDGSTTVWVNELEVQARALSRRPVEKGEPVTADDIADVRSVTLGVDIPPDAGFAFVYENGWDRAYFFDFGPLATGVPRTFDVSAELGTQETYLLHRNRCRLTDEEWAALLSQDWFPFILLPQRTLELMFGLLRAGRSVDLVLNEISEAVEARLPTFLSGMEAKPALAAQIPFIERAIEHFRNGDFLSSVSVLFPRIEGIWRGIARPAGPAPHKALAKTVIEAGATRLSPVSPLLAVRFLEFLKARFLPSFDPSRPEGLTRHTVSHGVASAEEFNRRGALLSLLIVNQLRYFVPEDAESAEVVP